MPASGSALLPAIASATAGRPCAGERRRACAPRSAAATAVRLGRRVLPARAGPVHRRDRACAARRSPRARGAGQLPGAGVAPVQDAAGEPAAVARDDGAAHAVRRSGRAPLIDRMLADSRAWRPWSPRSWRARAWSAAGSICRSSRLQLAGAVAASWAHLEERARRRRSHLLRHRARAAGARRSAGAGRGGAQLLENALAAVAPVGGGTIALDGAPPRRRGRAGGARHGVGFRPADGARLFEKFTRLHPGGGSSYSGTGLGLFIVRRLMQLARRPCQRAQRRASGKGAELRAGWPAAPGAHVNACHPVLSVSGRRG